MNVIEVVVKGHWVLRMLANDIECSGHVYYTRAVVTGRRLLRI